MFKFVAVFALLACVAAQRHGHGHGQSHGFAAHAPNHATTDDVHAEIIAAKSDVRYDGFDYLLETTNAIKAQASGDAFGNAQGNFEWISPEGEHIAVKYVANENGYQPDSASLPVPPPIPEAILKSLRYIETHPHYEETKKPAVQHFQKGRRF
ncbi:hypothetical protein DOY81_004635 [Sarcophaga bullata]|nr:hypothetical protein DOY81_004635 [Sarcophaga bullata]